MSDKHVLAVRDKMRDRARAGLRKYGVTTERQDLSTLDWLNHLQQEVMDAAVYCERSMEDVDKLTKDRDDLRAFVKAQTHDECCLTRNSTNPEKQKDPFCTCWKSKAPGWPFAEFGKTEPRK